MPKFMNKNNNQEYKKCQENTEEDGHEIINNYELIITNMNRMVTIHTFIIEGFIFTSPSDL